MAVMILLGLIIGMIPAQRAVKIRPIEAFDLNNKEAFKKNLINYNQLNISYTMKKLSVKK